MTNIYKYDIILKKLGHILAPQHEEVPSHPRSHDLHLPRLRSQRHHDHLQQHGGDHAGRPQNEKASQGNLRQAQGHQRHLVPEGLQEDRQEPSSPTVAIPKGTKERTPQAGALFILKKYFCTVY